MILAIVAILLMTIAIPLASNASTTGRRNTAIGLTAVAAYLLIRGNTVPGILAAGGAAYGWNRYSHARRDDSYRSRYGYYGDPGYGYYGNRDRDRDRDRFDNRRSDHGRDRDRDRFHDNGRWDRGHDRD
jgi:hypothetical protein